MKFLRKLNNHIVETKLRRPFKNVAKYENTLRLYKFILK